MKLPLLVTVTFCLCTSYSSKAQLDSCNAFLQGNYVEVGINWNGAYGSSAAAPPGFHPRGASNVANSFACDTTAFATHSRHLGFAADPDKDGWAVGTPAYYGDYYMPGSPQEGWAILSSGSQANAYNIGGMNYHALLDSRITGSNTTYYVSGTTKVTIWEGMYDSLQITQTTELDTTKTYFTTHVKLKNTGHVARTNVYYLRTLDPDNDEALSGDFTTKNKIETQYPGNVPLISTWGLHYSNAYLGLGTADTPAKAFVLKMGLAPNRRIDSIYNGLDTTVILTDSNTLDVGIGLVFKVGTLNPVDTTMIAFAYMFKRADVDSGLKSTTFMPVNPPDTNTVVNNVTAKQNNIQIYPNPIKNGLSIIGLSAGDYITLYDMMGRKVENWYILHDGANNFNTTMLPTGMYILKVIDRTGEVKAKIPLQKL